MNRYHGKATIAFSGTLEVDIADLDIEDNEASDEQEVEDIIREWAYDEIKQNGASCIIDKVSIEGLEFEESEPEPDEVEPYEDEVAPEHPGVE